MPTQKRRRPRKNLYRFNVKGPVPGFKDAINKWTSAVNEGQALLQIQRRLEKKYRVPVYLGNCIATKSEIKKEEV